MSINLKRTLYLGLSLLTLAPVSTGVMQVTANAKARHPRIARIKKRHKKVIKRTKNRKHRTNKERIKTPWKQSWAKDARVYPISGWLKYKGKPMISLRNWNKRGRDIGNYNGPESTEYRSGWDAFFQKHLNKNSFSNRIMTYPQYDQDFCANWNGKVLTHNKYYDIAETNDFRLNKLKISELLSNLPLHRYTAHQKHVLRSTDVPAHNRQAIMPSFHRMMRRDHDHPSIMVGKNRYIWNPRTHHFDNYKGRNGYGVMYKFNTKTNRYQRLTPKAKAKQVKKVTKADKNVQKQIQQVEAKLKAADAKVAQDKRAKRVINTTADNAQNKPRNQQKKANQAAQDNNNNIPVVTQWDASAANGNQSDTPATLLEDSAKQAYAPSIRQIKSRDVQAQRQDNNDQHIKDMNEMKAIVNKANHMTQVAQQQAEAYKASEKASNTINRNAKNDLLSLLANGAFANMNSNKQAAECRYLLAHPAKLAKMTREYKAGQKTYVTKNANKLVKAANHHAKNTSKSDNQNNNSVITNDQGYAQQLAQLNRDEQILSMLHGMAPNKGQQVPVL